MFDDRGLDSLRWRGRMSFSHQRVERVGWRRLVGVCFVTAFLMAFPLHAQDQGQRVQPGLTTVEPVGQQPANQAQTAHTESTPVQNPDYVIGPEDILRVDVFNVPELSGLQVRVENDGTIPLPLLGHVQASGLTPEQLAHNLEAAWGSNYLQDPQVTVYVVEYHAKPVSVVGEVQNPGLYYLTGPRNLIEVLSMAGGLAKRMNGAPGRSVYITRQSGYPDFQGSDGMQLVSPTKLEVDLRKLFYSNNDAYNIPIKPLDIISVSKADIIYVTGRGVRQPGGFVLGDQDNVTVFQALAMAQGLTANASRHNALIIRRKPDGSRVEVPVNLDKILRGNEPDLTLAANDILFVPDSAQKAAMKRGAEAIIGTLTGLLVYGHY
jgi:polysaccharide biosynthesis/export protein